MRPPKSQSCSVAEALHLRATTGLFKHVGCCSSLQQTTFCTFAKIYLFSEMMLQDNFSLRLKPTVLQYVCMYVNIYIYIILKQQGILTNVQEDYVTDSMGGNLKAVCVCVCLYMYIYNTKVARDFDQFSRRLRYRFYEWKSESCMCLCLSIYVYI